MRRRKRPAWPPRPVAGSIEVGLEDGHAEILHHLPLFLVLGEGADGVVAEIDLGRILDLAKATTLNCGLPNLVRK